MPKRDAQFVAGFGIALAEAHRLHGDPVIVKDTIVANGFTLADFAGAGLEEYDLAELRTCLAEG